MANTYVDYTATAGQTDFNFSFPYLENDHVEVFIDGVKSTAFTIVLSPNRIVLDTAATGGEVVRVRRSSDPTEDLVDFVNGSILTESDLDRAYLHNRYLNEEAYEGNTSSLQTAAGSTNFDANFNKIVNLAPPTNSTDAANKNYVDDKLVLSGTSLSGFNKSTHTGDNATTTFNLSFTPQTGTASAFRVAIDGVLQTPDDAYTVDNGASTITFTSAPPTNAEIVVIATGTAQDVNSVGVTATGSTQARSLADRFADVVNVLDYGVKNDGTEPSGDSNATRIQSVINSSATTIYFPDGVYNINAELSIPSNKNFKLSEGAIIRAEAGFMTSGSGNSMFVFQSDATNITITGGEIDGNSTQASDLLIWPNSAGNSTSPFSRPVMLIVMQSNDHVTIDGVKFKNSIGTAIKEFGTFSGGTNGHFLNVKNCYFDNILGNCIDGEIKNIQVNNNTVNLIGDIRGTSSAGTKGGLLVVKTQYGICSNNLIRQTTDSSIYITGSGFGSVSVTGNNIRYSGKDAIKILESSCNSVIDSNVVIAAGSSCIGVYDAGGTDDKGQSIISNNVVGFVDTPTDILDPLNNYSAKTITGCNNQSSLWGEYYDRTAIGAAASGLLIDGNKITNCIGVAFNPVEQNIVIQNNVVENCTGAGCYIQSTDVTVANNLFYDIGSNLQESPLDRSDPNKAPLGRIQGIAIIGDNDRVIVKNNQIKLCGGDGILCETNSELVNISGNIIQDVANSSGSASIYVNSAATPNTTFQLIINENQIRNDGDTIRGIYIRSVDDLIVSNNIVENGTDGIRIDACGEMTVSSNRVKSVTDDGIRVSGTTNVASVMGNTVDNANRGVVTDIGTSSVTAFGNISTNTTTSSYSFEGSTVKPAVLSDANI